MEIGSEFYFQEKKEERFGKIYWKDWERNLGYAEMTSSGRGAISLMLQEVEPREKTVCLPAYLCDSILLPFKFNGYECMFYDIEKDLSPDLDSVRKMMNERKIGIFYHMGYFGFHTNQKLIPILEELHRKETIVVEDITHTLFSDGYQRMNNDYVIASIRKWMALPTGGLLASQLKREDKHLSPDIALAELRKEAFQCKTEFINKVKENPSDHISLKDLYLSLFHLGEEHLVKDYTVHGMDPYSCSLLQEESLSFLIKRRRNNFKFLSENLGITHILQPVFMKSSYQICPMFFPIYCKDVRNELRTYLSRNEIYCPIHWPIPKEIDLGGFSKTQEIYQSILSIPCDQRYEALDMERVIQVLKDFINSHT